MKKGKKMMNSKAICFRRFDFDFSLLVEKPANSSQPKVDSIPVVVDLFHLGSEKDQDQRFGWRVDLQLAAKF